MPNPLDPLESTDGSSSPQPQQPQSVNPPNIAPSSQPSLFRGLLTGALLGLAAGSNRTGPAANAAGSIGAGIGGVVNAEQQNYQNRLTSAANNRANLAQMTEEQRFDLEKSTALIQKLHLEALIQQMSNEDRRATLKQYMDASELYKQNGAVSLGEVDSGDMGTFFTSHPQYKAGDIHPNPVGFDSDGHPDRYEMLLLNNAMIPSGTTVKVGGQSYTLSAPLPASKLDAANINEMLTNAKETVINQGKVDAALARGKARAAGLPAAAGDSLMALPTKDRAQALKIYGPALDADQRLLTMRQNLQSAMNGDQQAMISLLTNHIGMTLGAQKGARITKDIIHEAQDSAPWLSTIGAKFDSRGVLSGVTLTPDQMKQMVNLAEEQRVIQWNKARSLAKYAGFKIEPTPLAGLSVAGAPSNAGQGQSGGAPQGNNFFSQFGGQQRAQ